MALASPPSARSSIQIHMPLPMGRPPRVAGATTPPAAGAIGVTGAAAGTVVVSAAAGAVVGSLVAGASADVVVDAGVDEVVVGAASPAAAGASIRFTIAARRWRW